MTRWWNVSSSLQLSRRSFNKKRSKESRRGLILMIYSLAIKQGKGGNAPTLKVDYGQNEGKLAA